MPECQQNHGEGPIQQARSRRVWQAHMLVGSCFCGLRGGGCRRPLNTGAAFSHLCLALYHRAPSGVSARGLSTSLPGRRLSGGVRVGVPLAPGLGGILGPGAPGSAPAVRPSKESVRHAVKLSQSHMRAVWARNLWHRALKTVRLFVSQKKNGKNGKNRRTFKGILGFPGARQAPWASWEAGVKIQPKKQRVGRRGVAEGKGVKTTQRTATTQLSSVPGSAAPALAAAGVHDVPPTNEAAGKKQAEMKMP